MPSAADRGSLRTASVEYLVDDEDEAAGAGSGVRDVRRPHTSATPGGRGTAMLRMGSAGKSIGSSGKQHEPDVRCLWAVVVEMRVVVAAIVFFDVTKSQMMKAIFKMPIRCCRCWWWTKGLA